MNFTMRKSLSKLSVIITTYNRYEKLLKQIQRVKSQTYKNIEIIVSDDCSTDETYKVKDIEGIKYIKTPQNLGCAKNSLYALRKALGDYVIFLSDDDELIYERFFEEAVKKLDNGVDLVVGRSVTEYKRELFKKEYPFKKYYTSEEFLHEFINFGFFFTDYFSFSSMIFKRDIFIKMKPFTSVLEKEFGDVNSVDLSNIIKYVYSVKNIFFLNNIVYKWKKPDEDSISGIKKDDITYQTIQSVTAACDIYKFVGEKSKELCNGYLKYIFNAIMSDYEQTKNDIHFSNLLNRLTSKEVYIYGQGWVGLKLKEFLEKNGIEVKGFIDDNRKGENVLTFEEFKYQPKDVIIANYKYEAIYKIYKKLSKLNIQIFDLYGE